MMVVKTVSPDCNRCLPFQRRTSALSVSAVPKRHGKKTNGIEFRQLISGGRWIQFDSSGYSDGLFTMVIFYGNGDTERICFLL